MNYGVSFGSRISLSLVKEFSANVWEVRKQKLYGDDSCRNQLQSQSSPGGVGVTAGVEGQRDDKFWEGISVLLCLLQSECWCMYFVCC